MPKPPNPHDRLFRKAMKNPTVAKEFFTLHLPQDIQSAITPDSLTLCNDSFIDDALREQITDILYSAKFGEDTGYLYTVVEHKSYARNLCLWTLKATVEIMIRHAQTHKTDKLPLVFPIIFYHGKQPYSYSTDIRDFITAPQALIDKYFLQPFHLVDLNTIDDKVLRQYLWAGILQTTQKHIFDRDFLPHLRTMLQWLRTLQEQGQSGEELVENLLYYIGGRGGVDDHATFEQLVYEQLPEMREKMSTVFEQLRQEGAEQGAEQARQQMAKRLLARGNLPIDEISHLTDLSPEAIRSLQETTEAAA